MFLQDKIKLKSHSYFVASVGVFTALGFLIVAFGPVIKSGQDSLYSEILRFREAQKVDILMVTLGEQGIVLSTKDKIYHVPAIKREVFDVTGAGDMVISAFTLAELSGYSIMDSAILASVAAGIEVTKLGASPVTLEEINDVLLEEYEPLKKHTKCISF
jgi:bifunctional ADP-heptose synthase (sugar kinase/adenylyltransferase)